MRLSVTDAYLPKRQHSFITSAADAIAMDAILSMIGSEFSQSQESQSQSPVGSKRQLSPNPHVVSPPKRVRGSAEVELLPASLEITWESSQDDNDIDLLLGVAESEEAADGIQREAAVRDQAPQEEDCDRMPVAIISSAVAPVTDRQDGSRSLPVVCSDDEDDRVVEEIILGTPPAYAAASQSSADVDIGVGVGVDMEEGRDVQEVTPLERRRSFRCAANTITTFSQETRFSLSRQARGSGESIVLPSSFLCAGKATNTVMLREALANSAAAREDDLACRTVAFCVCYAYGRNSLRSDHVSGPDEPVAVVILPVKQHSPFVVHLAGSDEMEVSTEERRQLISDFLEDPRLLKVSFGSQLALQSLHHACPPLGSVVGLLDVGIAWHLLNTDVVEFSLDDLVTQVLPAGHLARAADGKRLVSDLVHLLRLAPQLTAALQIACLNATLKIEMDVLPSVAVMAATGLSCSEDSLRHLRDDLEALLTSLRRQADEILGHHIELSSPVEVAAALYAELGLRRPQPGSSGRHSTRAAFAAYSSFLGHEPAGPADKWSDSVGDAALVRLVPLHSFASLVLDYRAGKRLLSSWVVPLQTALYGSAVSGRIQGQWKSAGTATGRLTCASPPLQGLPGQATTFRSVSNNLSIHVRSVFKAAPGCVLLAADYSQVEMRVLAHAANDEALLDILSSGQDVHRLIASRWLGKDVAEVTAEDRHDAKRVGYGIVYGIGSKSLSTMLGVTKATSAAFMSSFLDCFPGVATWMKTVVAGARKDGHVRTIFARRRLLPDISASIPHLRKKAERQAINTPIQGTVSDILKVAQAGVFRRLSAMFPDGDSARLVLSLHDELVLEVQESKLAEVAVVLAEEMQQAALPIAVPVSLSSGPTFGDLAVFQLPRTIGDIIGDGGAEGLLVWQGAHCACLVPRGSGLCPAHFVIAYKASCSAWSRLPSTVAAEAAFALSRLSTAIETLGYPSPSVTARPSSGGGICCLHALPGVAGVSMEELLKVELELLQGQSGAPAEAESLASRIRAVWQL